MTKKEISLSEWQAPVSLEVCPGKTLFEALAERDLTLEAGCNGKGRCGRCRVKYLTAAPLPTATERRFFTAQELREGMRLACLHPVNRACSVEPAYLQPARVEIVTADGLSTENLMHSADGALAQNPVHTADSVSTENPTHTAVSTSAADAAGRAFGGDWCIAIDLGTTTIAMQARSLSDGAVLGVWKSMNPQRRFGSDVISRMQAACEGHVHELKACVEAVLAAGIRQLLQEVSGSLRGIYLAGNTVMEHLLAGWPVEELSRHPFRPFTLEEHGIELALTAKNGDGERGGCANAEAALRTAVKDARRADAEGTFCAGAECRQRADAVSVTLLPGFSAFVGADLLAGVLACGIHRREEISLLIDLGTNGEIVLGNRHRLMCTATAAGPAFEGGPGNPVPGTDMIAVIAELLDAGIVDETGLMAEPWFGTGIDWEPENAETTAAMDGRAGSAEPGKTMDNRASVHMTQEQIRAIQMAKAAIYAGVCILTKEYGIAFSDIRQVYLAGGFGYYLNVEKAVRIGLFPAELADRVKAVGNTSLAGAYIYGRNGAQKEAASIRETCTAVNLAENPDFEAIYLEHLNL